MALLLEIITKSGRLGGRLSHGQTAPTKDPVHLPTQCCLLLWNKPFVSANDHEGLGLLLILGRCKNPDMIQTLKLLPNWERLWAQPCACYTSSLLSLDIIVWLSGLPSPSHHLSMNKCQHSENSVFWAWHGYSYLEIRVWLAALRRPSKDQACQQTLIRELHHRLQALYFL